MIATSGPVPVGRCVLPSSVPTPATSITVTARASRMYGMSSAMKIAGVAKPSP